jgi:hypothetical protein
MRVSSISETSPPTQEAALAEAAALGAQLAQADMAALGEVAIDEAPPEEAPSNVIPLRPADGAATPPDTTDDVMMFGPEFVQVQLMCVAAGVNYEALRDAGAQRMRDMAAKENAMKAELAALLPPEAWDAFPAAMSLMHEMEQARMTTLALMDQNLLTGPASEVIASTLGRINDEMCHFVSAALTQAATRVAHLPDVFYNNEITPRYNAIMEHKRQSFVAVREIVMNAAVEVRKGMMAKQAKADPAPADAGTVH